MMPPEIALCFTCLFMARLAHMTHSKQSLKFKSAKVGGNVTLPCLCDSPAVMFYWYKQTLGHRPMLVSTFYKHSSIGTFYSEFENNSRFSLEIEKHKNDLKIINLQIEDSATYHCVKSNLYDLEFCEGTTVSVEGSGLNIPALVHQSVSETIQPGYSVILTCTVHTGTCDGEHSVYWFKDSEESHPGIIYTHGGSSTQCKDKSDTQTHTCVYNLPVDHAGTYYCAVGSCGHILFGNGTNVDFKAESTVLVYFLSGALAFTTILAVLLVFSVYKIYKCKSRCAESNVTSATTSTAVTEMLHHDGENLHYAALRNQKVNKSQRQRDEAGENECVYSSIKQ
ncbi:hypothetical protein Q5P01_002241 [Channa striata]|uniref:Ig-like domain-containing protein n=1 Tax=Channa striata TaxID=64152 RepID=A0AA88NSY5_CHASR|nr:hypothetical protein Q5P01_002241 [Channa striata]